VTDAQEPTDEELVRRIRSGDEAAARKLFDRHRARLRARTRSRLPASLKGRLGESDVIQDAYLAAFQAMGDFEDRGGGSFAAWLRTILDRRLSNAIRDGVGTVKRDARRDVPMGTDSSDLPATRGQPSPSDEAVSAEEGARVRAALASLSDDHRRVITLVHEEGLSLAQAGERMGRSADAARKLYARAIAELAARLGAGRERRR